MKPFSGMNSQNTALIIIDIINSCAHQKCEIPEWKISFNKIRVMVPRLNTFIDEFRATVGGPVIFGKTQPWQKEYLADNINELYEDEQFSYYSKDLSGFAEEFYGITPSKDDIITTKDTNDALADPKLIAQLQARGIKYIVTTGVFTDGCVLATVVSGFSKGFNFVVLKDLVETTDSPTRQRLQKDLLEFTFPYMFARVVSSEEFLSNWVG